MTNQIFVYDKNEFWASENGVNYTKKSNLPSVLSAVPSVTPHNGKLVMVGSFSTGSTGKCWHSSDGGVTWNEVATLPSEFGIRTGTNFKLISAFGSLFCIGGTALETKQNDILRSDNEGLTWSVVTQATPTTRDVSNYSLLNSSLYLYGSTNTINWTTSDFNSFTTFTRNINLVFPYISSGNIFTSILAGGRQFLKSTNGTAFTSFAFYYYGDPELEEPDYLPPNTAFMDLGDVVTFEYNSRLYFIHTVNKAVMSAPTSNPSNFQSEANSNMPTLTSMQVVSGDITVSAQPTKLSTSANSASASSLTSSGTIKEPPTPLQASVIHAGASSATASSTIKEPPLQPPLNASVSFVSGSSLEGNGILTIVAITLRGGTVRKGGIPQQGINVYIKRVSDGAEFIAVTDIEGKYTIPDEAGECHVYVAHSNGTNKYADGIRAFIPVVN